MNDLIKKINNWVKTNEYKDSVLKEQEELKKLEEFNNIFNENKISNMSIDEYVIGKGEKTFCYYVEQKLKFFGNISGRTNAYQKFVIYWDDLKNKYVFGGKNHKNRKGFGSNINEIFTNIKEQLLEIIKFSKENDYKSISLSPFNKQFKNKLAFLYNHKNQLPIYSEDHLDKILKLLEINFDSLDTVESKRKALWDFYTKNSINKILSSNMFIAFIYSNSGFLNKLKNNIKLIDFNVDVLEESNNKKIQKKSFY
ncbi:Uncharacterised protein [Mycoplasmopsis maculosa]|uniref:Uncharacterized protein n=1 Tax=Mycoplasmopsis maculosa TaxID=114885 RepID=A0A449B443_9BACT|nr:hypothetical protein [Mycoplasmopsis maculosa]VEU75346.1 Uncharacterised protein [Mycoplasmopsis maculosa]